MSRLLKVKEQKKKKIAANMAQQARYLAPDLVQSNSGVRIDHREREWTSLEQTATRETATLGIRVTNGASVA